MSAVSPATSRALGFGPKERSILFEPVLVNNPIGVQVLGITNQAPQILLGLFQ